MGGDRWTKFLGGKHGWIKYHRCIYIGISVDVFLQLVVLPPKLSLSLSLHVFSLEIRRDGGRLGTCLWKTVIMETMPCNL